MIRGLTVLSFLALLVGAVMIAPQTPGLAQSGEAEGLSAWETAYEVFSHPRCVNCHVPEDNRPRWSGPSYGPVPQYHGMNVIADATRARAAGMPCSACHGNQNLPFPKGAPGAPGWVLAPVEMVWWDKSSLEICEQIKDPERNGGKTVEEVADHVANDALVLWGWDPGPGREPAPHSADELASLLRVWADAGTPCPKSAG